MGKQQLQQRETQVSTNEGVGKQVEHSYTIDDSLLPSPQELEAYKLIDPRIVDHLLNASEKEQEHRHEMDRQKIAVIGSIEKKTGNINMRGMFYAFLSIVLMLCLSAYALYLDKPWFAGIMGATTLASVASVFIGGGKNKNTPNDSSVDKKKVSKK